MTDEELHNQLITLKSSDRFWSRKIHQPQYVELVEYINRLTPLLQGTDFCYNVNTKVYWILNGLTDFPICPTCGKHYGYNQNVSDTHPYHDHCSTTCANHDPIVMQKFKDTNLQRYGEICSSKNASVKAKSKETCQAKYGCSNPMQNKDINDKAKAALESHYGVSVPLHNDSLKNKARKTCQAKYGCSNPMQNDDVKAKQEATMKAKYGVTKALQSNCFLEKVKTTSLDRYGYEYASQDPKRKAATKLTNIDKYGTECALQNPQVHSKTIETLKSRYGVEHVSQSLTIRNRISKSLRKYYENDENVRKRAESLARILDQKYGLRGSDGKREGYKKKIAETISKKYNVRSTFMIKEVREKLVKRNFELKYNSIMNTEVHLQCTLDEFIAQCNGKIMNQYITNFSWICTKCGNIFEASVDENFYMNTHFGYARCSNCHPRKHQLENTFIEFVESLYGNVIRNCKTILSNHLELDLYIPEKHLAFEFDGVYWHSECQKKDKNYHLSKTLECADKGIHLIHVFENEWITKRPIVESRVRNLLGLCSDRIFARKCTIKEVDPAISIQFQTANHLQGAVRTSYNIGLYYKDELVSLMTFGKPRFNNRYEWELLRFCNKLNTSVVGGASRLLRYFEKTYNPKSLISYADRRWSNGNVYYALGFDYDHASEPNYWYWKNSSDVLYNRITFQKYKLPQLLEHFNPNLTEVENMYANGYNRIFDCGNLVFVKLYRKDADD